MFALLSLLKRLFFYSFGYSFVDFIVKQGSLHVTKKLTKNFKFKFKCLGAVLFAAVLSVMPIFVGCAKQTNNNKNIYLVYCTKSDNMASAEYESKVVEDAGGSGVIYGSRIKYIVASAYFDFQCAKKVTDNIKNQFSQAGVIKLDCNLDKKQQKQINKILICKNYYEKLWDFCNEIYSLSIGLDKLEIKSSDVYHKIIDYRQQIKVLKDLLEKNNEKVAASCHSSSMVIIQIIDNFYQSAFVSSGLGKYLKKLLVMSCIELFDLKNLI